MFNYQEMNAMLFQYFRAIAVFVVVMQLSACATQINPDPQRMAAARRVMINMDAKSFFLAGVKKGVEKYRRETPGLADLAERITTQPKFIREAEEVMASSYARYMTVNELNGLADFAGSKTGRLVFRAVLTNPESEGKDIMKYLNADEMADLARFGQSDAAKGYQRAKNNINRDMQRGVKELTEKAVQDYLDNPPPAKVEKSAAINSYS